MHIGVILDTEFKTDIRVRNEVSFLLKSGYQISVFCPNYSSNPNFEIYGTVKIYRFNLNKSLKNKLFGLSNIFPFYNWLWTSKVKKFIQQTDVNVLHAHDLYMSKPVYMAGKRYKLPIVIDLHENYPEAILSYEWATRGLMKYLALPEKWRIKEPEYLRYANKLVVLSSSFKKDLLTRFSFLSEKDIFEYPNVPDINHLLGFSVDASILTKEPDDFVLFYFGGISKRRGIFTCIAALENLLPKYKNIKLLLIGPVDSIENEEFKRAINKESVRNNIIFYPWKDIKYLPSYILASDVCLSPIVKNKQHESGVANKIFQYMLFERPLLVSNCAPQVEIVDNSNCGVSFESENVKDLCDKIVMLYNDRELCCMLGKSGKEAVLSKYNTDKCGEVFLELYSSLNFS